MASKEFEVKSVLLSALEPLAQAGRLPIALLVEKLTQLKVFMHPVCLKTLVQEHSDIDVKQFLELLYFDRHSTKWQMRRLPTVHSPNVRFTFTSYGNGILSQDLSRPEVVTAVKVEDVHAKLYVLLRATALQAEGLELSQLFFLKSVFERLQKAGSVPAEVFVKALIGTKSQVPIDILKAIVKAVQNTASSISQIRLNSFLLACKLARPDGRLNKSEV